MKRLLPLLVFVAFLVPHHTQAAVFYIDFVNGSDGAAGTATTTAFQSLNQFANSARTAGDVAFVRRGMASTTNVTAVTFTTDGTLNRPITISADYDNLWNEFASSTVTWTPTFGSTYITSSASSTDFTSTNKWVYFQGDCSETFNSARLNPCEFAYEIASSSPDGISLYLPYKGNQAGSAKNMRVMPSAPQVGDVTQANQILSLSGDDYWYFKGLDLRSTNATIAQVAGNRSTVIFDTIFQSNGTSVSVISNADLSLLLKKVRTFNASATATFATTPGVTIEDSLFDCNNVAASNFVTASQSNTVFKIKDSKIANCANDFRSSGGTIAVLGYFSNVQRNNTPLFLSGSSYVRNYFEDDFGLVGLNSQASNQIGADSLATTTMSTSTNLRVGGGLRNAVFFPPSGTANTGLSTYYFPFSYYKLFEYPIYADTSSKTYTVYFNSTSTAQWTTSPGTVATAASSTPEMYIECEYYNAATGANRILKRSNTASAINFAGSTAWQSLSVTCQPTQSGILYLRGWYGKTRETGGNIFYMDTTPLIN